MGGQFYLKHYNNGLQLGVKITSFSLYVGVMNFVQNFISDVPKVGLW